jgi:hypothetical protein
MLLARLIGAAAIVLVATPALSAAGPGEAAPDFIAADSNGKPVKLSGFKGKIVVLEWNNPGCPFVQKHYDSGNMQRTQQAAAEAGAVWLTVNSGAPGKQGHLNGVGANSFVKSKGAKPTAYLLDHKGVVGRLYGAKTTPEMVVIDTAGKIAYQGGIDDKATADPADIRTARNHVLAALKELSAGKPVSVAQSRPYGCSVKYGS